MKDVPFKKIAVILKYQSASRDSKTDCRARKAITHAIQSEKQRKGRWYSHHIPCYNLYDAALQKILVPVLLDKFCHRNSYQDGGGGESLTSFANKVRFIDLGSVKSLNLSSNRMLRIWTPPRQRWAGTQVITSDNDYSYCLHCNSIQEPQPQLKASLYWLLNKVK